MTKQQSARFDKLYNDTINWGDEEEYGICTGMFEEFGENLEYLSTGIDSSSNTLGIYEFNGSFWDHITSLPINSTTKAIFKKIVCHLMSDGFDTLNV